MLTITDLFLKKERENPDIVKQYHDTQQNLALALRLSRATSIYLDFLNRVV